MTGKTVLFFLALSIPVFGELSLQCLSLKDAEYLALECNKQLLIAKESTEQARERRKQAVSRLLPQVFYHAEFREITQKELFFDVFSPVFKFNHQGYSSILQLNQPLFSTDLIYGLKSKTIEAQSVEYSQANTQNELLFSVRDNYYKVLYYERALDIQRENIDYFTYALKQEQGRLESGNATPFEVNQSKVSVANAISLYYSTLKDLKNARNAFILTLGIDPLLEPEIYLQERQYPIDSIPELSLKLQELDQVYHYRSDTFPTTSDFTRHITKLENARQLTLFTEQEVADYLDLALSLRPDLLAKKMEVGVANENVKLKQGHYFPEISGYVRYSYNDELLGPTPFFAEPYHFAFGVSLNWNLFDSFLREHEIREARSVRTASRIGYDKEFQRIEVEVRNGLYQLEEAMLSYLSSTQSVFVAEQAREQAKEKLTFGRIPPLDYRDSVNQLAQARNLLNKASFDLIAAYYQLRYSTGLDAK